MKELIELLKRKGLTLSSCESCTGGLFAASITAVPKVSSVFKGAVVTYFTEIKTRVVGVAEETVEKYGVVSPQVAAQMAERTNELMQSDVCVSFTGNAGPDVMEGKPAGLIYCAVSFHQKTAVFECHFHGTRNEIREACVKEMTEKCIELLND